MSASQSLSCLVACGASLLAGWAGLARADVTVEQQSTMDLAFIKMHITHSEAISGLKKREDSQSKCDGFMSMFCGKAGHGEIVRVDQAMSYDLEPAKKQYREHPFPTVAERQEMQRRMEQAMQKMKQCAAQQPQQPAVDTSKCKMSPAKLEVKNLGAAGQILGHDVHRTAVTMTSTCTNEQTGDACDMQFGFDSWLTDDQIAGLDDQRAFNKAYAEKMGFTKDAMAAMAKQMQQFLAPYAEQMKELQSKSADLKGQSLRTAFHVSYGGAKCAAAKKSEGGSTAGAGPGGVTSGDVTDAVANSTAAAAAAKAADGSVGGSIASSTLSSVGGKLLSGLFKKKASSDAAAKPPAATDASAAAAAGAAPAGMATLISMTVETTAITSGSVPSDRFEIPAGWKKIEPPPGKTKDEDFSCPKSGKDQ